MVPLSEHNDLTEERRYAPLQKTIQTRDLSTCLLFIHTLLRDKFSEI